MLHVETSPTRAPPTADAARLFLSHVGRESSMAADAIGKIVKPLVQRAKLGRGPRAELIAGASAAWAKSVPAAGRVRSLEIRKCLSSGKLSLAVTDVRFSTSAVALIEDGDSRDAICIARIELRVSRAGTSFQAVPICTVQGHAIERYVERCPNVTDDTLRAAIVALADGASDALRRAEADPDHDS